MSTPQPPPFGEAGFLTLTPEDPPTRDPPSSDPPSAEPSSTDFLSNDPASENPPLDDPTTSDRSPNKNPTNNIVPKQVSLDTPPTTILTPPSTRPQKGEMRLLVLGLCRTGTSSLRNALQMLGYESVYHMFTLETASAEECIMWLYALSLLDEAHKSRRFRQQPRDAIPELDRAFWDKLLKGTEAVTDVPTSLFYPELLAAYPSIPVILTVRAPSSTERDTTIARHLAGASTFATSVMQTILPMRRRIWFMTRSPFSNLFVRIAPLPRQILVRRLTLGVCCGDDAFVGRPEEERQMCERMYRKHNEAVLRTCESMGRSCLIYDVREGWEPLIRYLNEDEQGELSVPEDANGKDQEFPRLNDSATFQKVVGEKAAAMKARTQVLVHNVGMGLGVAVLAIGIGWYLRARRSL